jgi:hypothetical protein
MSRTSNSSVPLLFAIILALLARTETVSSQDKHEAFYRFVQNVQDVLAGNNRESSIAVIGRGARLVDGARLENLKSVVTGEVSGLSLVDTSYHGVMIQAETNPSEDAGYLILKTEMYDTTRVRFHTITFMKDSTGTYKINCWHSGDCSR